MKYTLNVDPRLKLPEEIASKHWELPVFMTFQGPVDEESARKFVDGLTGAENAARLANQEVLPLVIDSPGGCVYACLQIVDAMQDCSIKIATIVEGKAMSAGAVMFSCGAEGHRYIGPNATVMIHQAAHRGGGGKVHEVRANANELDRLNEKILKIMAANCGKPAGYFIDKIKKDHGNADWYLDAKTALKENVANHIRLPSFDIQVKMDYKFG